jgi:uronate dehydrogenase
MRESATVRKVLVTGAAGYQAGFVIERLRRHFALTLFDRVPPPVGRDNLPFVCGDITDGEAVRGACRGQDAVVHLVALVRERADKPAALFADVMVKGTWHVAQACVEEGVGRLVNLSSIAVTWPKEPVSDRPMSPDAPFRFIPGDLYYRMAKVLGEQVCDAYHDAHGLSVIHLRPGVIAGDGLNPGPLPAAAVAPTGRWFIYVDPRDVAQAVDAALSAQVSYGRYHIVAGRRDSLFEWQSAARQIGYAPAHNWPEIPQNEVGA